MYVQERCFQNLRLRGIQLKDYIQKMINRTTNGLDITLLIISMMLELTSLVLYKKYMWVSDYRDLYNCDLYLILNKNGHFKAACPKNGYKIVCQLPEECRPLYVTSDSGRDETGDTPMEPPKGMNNMAFML